MRVILSPSETSSFPSAVPLNQLRARNLWPGLEGGVALRQVMRVEKGK